MSDSVRIQHSKEELLAKARAFLIHVYGRPIDMDDQSEKDRWHSRLGMFVHFIDDIFEPPGKSGSAT